MKELFYQIIIEAANKRVYTDRPYNIAFNSIINTNNFTKEAKVILLNNLKKILATSETNIKVEVSNESILLSSEDNNNLFVPTLIINDLENILIKLEEYLKYARDFYDKNYYDSIEYEDKTLLTLLWSNATIEDFNNPISFIGKRINFLKDMTFNNYFEPQVLGSSSILFDSKIKVFVKKEPIYQETPYSFNAEILSNENLNDKYVLPTLRFGISNNKCTIMAIQNSKKNNDNNKYYKKIKRSLNKINQNFQKEENMDNEKYPENLTGIVPSFGIITTLFLSIIKSIGIEDVEVVTFLPVRWNAKELKYLKIKEIETKKEIDLTEIENKYRNNTLMHYDMQRNLSDKFIRNFRRLAYHLKNLKITSYPYEVDELMHFKITNDYFCNNSLLDEIYMLPNIEQQKRK